MARHIDLTSKFDNEKPSIKIGDKTFIVNDEKTTVLLMNQIMKNENLDDVSRMEKMLETLLGKKQAKELESLNLRFMNYQKVVFAIMAVINDEDLEEVEKRFQKQK